MIFNSLERPCVATLIRNGRASFCPQRQLAVIMRLMMNRKNNKGQGQQCGPVILTDGYDQADKKESGAGSIARRFTR